jgi:hypothetical protein
MEAILNNHHEKVAWENLGHYAYMVLEICYGIITLLSLPLVPFTSPPILGVTHDIQSQLG